MSPKVDFQIHEILVRALRSPFQKVEEFILLASGFQNYFENYKDKVLNSIVKFSGFEFTKEKIPVYLVPASKFSVLKSSAKSELEEKLPGVVLKIFDEHDITLHIFIHELVHINQWHNFETLKDNKYFKNMDGTRNEFGVELCADIVTLFVIRDLFGSDSKQEGHFWEFLKNTNDRNKKKLEELENALKKWDLTQKSLKEFIFE